MARKVLHSIAELCTGCRQCELVCSLTKTGTINPERARIRVSQSLKNGQVHLSFCRTCKVPLCQQACPVPEAMAVDAQTGAVAVDEASCIRCLACVDACPFGAISVGPEDEIQKCDLCGGDPTCVKYCVPRPAHQFPGLPYPRASALEYADPNRWTRRRLLTPADRR